METPFHLYIDRLQKGKVEEFNFFVEPVELDLKDQEVEFNEPAHIQGKAYLSEKDLVLHLGISVNVGMTCKICSEPVSYPLQILEAVHIIEHDAFKSAIYDFAPLAREEIFLAVPQFAECRGGCPQRKELKGILKDEAPLLTDDGLEGQQPFKDL